MEIAEITVEDKTMLLDMNLNWDSMGSENKDEAIWYSKGQ